MLEAFGRPKLADVWPCVALCGPVRPCVADFFLHDGAFAHENKPHDPNKMISHRTVLSCAMR